MTVYTLENAIQVRDILFEEAKTKDSLKPCLFFMEGLVNKIAKEQGVKPVRYRPPILKE